MNHCSIADHGPIIPLTPPRTRTPENELHERFDELFESLEFLREDLRTLERLLVHAIHDRKAERLPK